MRLWRRLAVALWPKLMCCLIAALPLGPVLAQQAVNVQAELQTQGTARLQVQSPILVIDSQRLFAETLFGQRIAEDVERARQALQDENNRIIAELEAEELDLTERRAGLEPEAFRALAEAFDSKAQRIRAERAAALEQLGARLDRERAAFLQEVVPVLRDIMFEAGAAVVMEQRDVLLNVLAVDVTDLAIERINQAFVDNSPAE